MFIARPAPPAACSCSCARQLEVPTGSFSLLEVLNLSYNALSSDAILALTEMPRLRQLDLSRNELTALPGDMSGFRTLQVKTAADDEIISGQSHVTIRHGEGAK